MVYVVIEAIPSASVDVRTHYCRVVSRLAYWWFTLIARGFVNVDYTRISAVTVSSCQCYLCVNPCLYMGLGSLQVKSCVRCNCDVYTWTM